MAGHGAERGVPCPRLWRGPYRRADGAPARYARLPARLLPQTRRSAADGLFGGELSAGDSLHGGRRRRFHAGRDRADVRAGLRPHGRPAPRPHTLDYRSFEIFSRLCRSYGADRSIRIRRFIPEPQQKGGAGMDGRTAAASARSGCDRPQGSAGPILQAALPANLFGRAPARRR